MFLLFLPFLAGQFLHIGHRVFFVHDFCAEHGFNHVFHGDNATEAAVFVNDDGDVFFFRQEFLPNLRHRVCFLESKYRAHYFRETRVKAVFREFLENCLAQYVTLYEVIVLFVEHWDTRVRAIGIVFIEFGERHVFLGHFHHGTWGHDVACRDVVEFQQVLDHAVLFLFQNSFFCADRNNGRNLLAAHGKRLLLGGNDVCNQFREHHKGVGEEHQSADDARAGQCELPPVGSADGLGDNFGSHKDKQREHGGGYAEPLVAEHFVALCAHSGRADGVRNGVERQDCGDRAVDVLLVAFE